ncbi:MAG: DNA repair protein RecN [Clostridia bacterium]|nr:DNA repair protein RecN [Clostridia bacterium]
MLNHLDIENIAVIEKAAIDFEAGLNVLTGETGAGKSIIIDAINAVLGFRTSRALVRTGADFAQVLAEFSPVPPSVQAYLQSLEMEVPEDSLILQRRIQADGKSSCRINSKPVTAAVMKQVGELLVNIHGQHDSQKLLDSTRHYRYIDKLLDDSTVLETYRAAYVQLVKTLKELKALQEDESEKERLTERLRYEIDEIEKADVYVGEKQKLADQKARLNALAALKETVHFAKMQLAGDEEAPGAQALVGAAIAKLEEAGFKELGAIAEKLLTAQEALNDAGEALTDQLADLDFSPETIEQIEDRLNLYYEFSNRYGSSEEEILAYLESAKERLNSIERADEKRAQLEAELAAQKEETYRLAQALSAARRKTAARFEKQVEEELHFLNMPAAVFRVDFRDGAITKTGIDEIEFLISVNAGEEPKPLASVASGGELSRIMLAFRAVLGAKEAVPTLIFDEIDTGVSGRAAGKVGRKLRQVSRSAQVICVSHLAQIAAAATAQYLIEKEEREGRTYTRVKALDFEGRQLEIARITGGMQINELMLENAKQLLKEYDNDNL